MLDERMRILKEKIFVPLARPLLALPPWLFSLLGLVVGMVAAGALWQRNYLVGFLLWFLNRLFDGLDGTVARQRAQSSDLGGYLDIVFDFIVYAAIPIGLALGRSTTPVYLSLIFLLAAYYVNAASWMYLAAILEKRKASRSASVTAVTMPGGLIGGTETILFYTAFIFFPGYLVFLFSFLAVLVSFTAGQRVWWALRALA